MIEARLSTGEFVAKVSEDGVDTFLVGAPHKDAIIVRGERLGLGGGNSGNITA